MSDVWVTNRTEEELIVEFNFKNYEFKPNKPVQISLAAARHIFGYTEQNKEPYLARLGWVRLHSELKQALAKLDQFEISTELPQKDRSLPSAVGVVPLHVKKRAGARTQAKAS